MKFSDIVKQATLLLRESGRSTYRALKLEFDLNDEQLEALKEELLYTHAEIVDDAGRGLVWTGAAPDSRAKGEDQQQETSNEKPIVSSQPPISYTPPHLAERIRAEQAALEARGTNDGERKTITALFADLKGSTALIEGLDPEEARAIIDPALQLMMDAVHRYDGYVAQALGDGIFALFGAPLAHEDHPQRALYAALRMQEEMHRYADTLRQKGYPPLLMRVGVNTGEVVVRSIRKDDLHTDYVPVGHSTNLAARMEQLAAPGSILVTEQTHKLTTGYFEFKALGRIQVKGVEEPLNVYEALGAGPLRTRLQVSAQRGLTRFVGRHSEMEQMRRALEQAKAGHGQIVGVMGEPGLGKSRLFYEFKLTSQSGYLLLEAYSVSHGKASPYLPVIELLKTYFQIQPQDDERTRREKVIGKVLGLDRSLEDTLPYLFALLGIDDQQANLQQMDPQIRRKRTFEALKRLILRESLNQPLMLIFEDLHWIDTETQGFLDTLSESVASARLMLLTNYRPEYRHEWGQKTYYTQLRLAPFGKAEAEEFLNELLGESFARRGSPDPADSADRRSSVPLVARSGDRPQLSDSSLHTLKQLILEKTEGTPFFIEEVVQTLAEEGVLSGERSQYRLEHAPSALHISPTVQGVLAARIDRLADDEKALLHHLAIMGRQFPLSLMRQVVPQTEEELYRLLSSLQRKEFLYEQPAFPEVEYLFKHALTQEVAYNSVLLERRKALHERTAQALEVLYASSLAEHYSDLAHHYMRSGNTEKAVEYLYLAGHQAVQHSANAEAIGHLTTALELLKTLPDTPERAQKELTLQIALGGALMVTKGWAAREVEQAYARARELCQQVGETPQLFPALWGLCLFHSGRGEFQTARKLGERLLSLAQSVQDPALLLEAHHPLWAISLVLGELAAAREHCEQGIALYDSQQHRSLTFLYGGHDPGGCCRDFAAWALWLLGYPDQALTRSQEALTLAHDLSHPASIGNALDFAAIVHQLRRESQAAHERAEAILTLLTDQGFSYWLVHATILRGWALAEQGQAAGIVQMRQGLATYRTAGAQELQSYFLALLVEAYGKGGQIQEGLSTLAEALAHVHKTGERFYEAELYRLRGELTLAQSSVQSLESGVQESQKAKGKSQKSSNTDPHAEAEACFLKAIEISHAQQAKSLELRAAMSLARLWQQHGKQVEARQILADIYGWFTEGFDTKDLQEAKALLAELN